MTAMFKLVSANLGTSLLSVGDILMTDKPELLFLQEVTCPTNELLTRVTSLGYSAECNVDSLHPTRPGTAIVWKKSLKINEVNSIIERRAQFIKVGGESYVNVYAPSGSNNKKEREDFFTELFLHLLNKGEGKLPVISGDFNSVLAEIDTTRHFSAKFSKVLRQLVRQAQYIDCFRFLHPAAQEFTFHRGAHMAQSRLDRVYAPPHLADKVMTACHKAGISDHCRVEVVLNIETGQTRRRFHRPGFWKLNTSLLDNDDFLPQFRFLYESLSNLIDEYDDIAQWWELLAKPSITKFCKDFSYQLAQERKATKHFLSTYLKILIQRERWSEVATTKEKLRKMLVYESMGLVVRSRQKEYAEEERGRIYY